MEIEFRTSREDYVKYYKAQLAGNFLKKSSYSCSVGFWIVAFSHPFSLLTTGKVIIAGAIFISVLFYFLPLYIHDRKLNQLLTSDAGYTELRKWTILDEGLQSEGASTSSLRKWEAFAGAKINQQYISFILKDKRFLMIPRSTFATEADAINFYGLAETNIVKPRGIQHQILPTIKKTSPLFVRSAGADSDNRWGCWRCIGFTRNI
ncbi:YcxB family protein [Mucilaginibacter antarcticus]|uniref:YcxB family protein n=1 Tax=Mucilaginibacter antarcticus TaxID=1855725 RepID=UPI0036291BDC